MSEEHKHVVAGELIMKAAFIINSSGVSSENLMVTFDSNAEEITVSERDNFEGKDIIRRSWSHDY